ncbi:hypothetical protein Rhopal_007123-T1 [Rhodotorula paludigena]|uniref:DUF895 domain membrane protein n=1 Tax=Rhodotorula paludigena TaxID=86838 RepID=A0AAV5GU58_9BASI|nr:hypothetical protein Rhopal_007123-T1 [Rhodotorula paludigena]
MAAETAAPAAAPVPRSTVMRIYRSTFFQILIVGIISLLAPGLWNGAQALGAGGALEPYLVNAGNSIVFALMGLGCILAPVLVNKLGVKTTLIGGTVGWSVYTAALYQNNRYGTEWFVIFGAVICGASAGLYWASEGAILLAYPEPHKRARYLSMWLFFKNSGQIIAGAINLGTNIHRSTGGKVNYKTLLSFLALQVVAFPAAFLISPPGKVVRKDRSPIHVADQTGTVEQFRLLWKTCRTQKIGVLLPIFFSSWFYWGYASTYLTLYFSVRARALASFLSAICGVAVTTLLGVFLDSQRWSLATRARVGGATVVTLFSAMLVWAVVVQKIYTDTNPGKLDWTSPQFGRGFGLYILLNAFGNGVQNYLYWLCGVLAHEDGLQTATRYAGLLRGVESWGQCAAFGISSSKFSPLYTVVINMCFWFASLPAAWITLSKVGVQPGYGGPSAATVAAAATTEASTGEGSVDETVKGDEGAEEEEKEVQGLQAV